METAPSFPEGYEHKNIALKLVANDSLEWTIHHGNLVINEFVYEPDMNHVVILHNDDPGDDNGDREYLVIHDSAVINTLMELGFPAPQTFVPTQEQIEKVQSINNASAEFYWDLTDLDGEMSLVHEDEQVEPNETSQTISLEDHCIKQLEQSVYYDAEDYPIVQIEVAGQKILLTHENTTVFLYRDRKYREIQHIKVTLAIDDEPHTIFYVNHKLGRALVGDLFFPKNISIRPTSEDMDKYASLISGDIAGDFRAHLEKQAPS